MTTPGMDVAAKMGRRITQRVIQYATPDAAAIAAAVREAFEPPGVERQVVLADKTGRIRYISSRCRITANDDGTVTLRDVSGEGGWR